MPPSGLRLRSLERRIESVDRLHLGLEAFASAVDGLDEGRLVRPERIAGPFDRAVAGPSRAVKGFPVAVQRSLRLGQGEYVERIRIPTGGATARVRHSLPRDLRGIEDIASERDGSPFGLVGSIALRRPWEGPARPPSSTSVQR